MFFSEFNFIIVLELDRILRKLYRIYRNLFRFLFIYRLGCIFMIEINCIKWNFFGRNSFVIEVLVEFFFLLIEVGRL